MTGDVVIHAHLRQVSDGTSKVDTLEYPPVQVEASYYDGRDRILADLSPGWIVASWRVE